MQRADVVVVGAGLAGLAVAHHLAPYRRVHVVDQGPHLGSEASSQNAAMIRTLVEDPVERALAVRSARWFREPDPTWSGPRPARTTGALLGLTIDPHHLDDAVAHLRAGGVAIRPAEPTDAPPWADPTHWATAFFLADAQVADPVAMLHGFASTVKAHGGEVTCGVRVEALLGTSKVVGVQTDQGPLQADAVVLGPGAYGRSLAARFGLHRPLVPLRRSVWRTGPHPSGRPDAPWVWLDDVGLYVRPEGNGFLVCGCDEQPEASPTEQGSRQPADPEMERITRERLTAFVPAVANLPFVEGWSGLRTFAPDRRPLLGPDPERDGLWWVAGLGGAGVTFAVAAGEAVATWLRGEPTDWLPPRPVKPGRPVLRRFPIRPQGDWTASRLLQVE